MAGDVQPSAKRKPISRWEWFGILLIALIVVWIFNGFLAFELLMWAFFILVVAKAIQGNRDPIIPRSTSVGCVYTSLAILGGLLLPLIVYSTVIIHGTNIVFNESMYQVQKQLMQIGKALHSQQEKHGYLPQPAILSKEGKPLLSWRVALLPFLGEEHLFGQFRLNEPWDSTHNLKLLENMPDVYAMPKHARQPRRGETYFQFFVGPGAVFEHGTSRTAKQIDDADGGNTLMGALALDAVPWTKPQDIDYSPDQSAPVLGPVYDAGPFPIWNVIWRDKARPSFGRSAVLTASGSAETWYTGREPESLRPHITWNGGEKEQPPW